MEWQREVSDPAEFIDTVKIDLFTDEVFVFTPKGRVVPLVQGSCPIDFAFAIHTEVGMHCNGARVNGKMVPLKHKLKNGDLVEVTTTAAQAPSKDWLSLDKPARAKNRIRANGRVQERKRSSEHGREQNHKELRKHGSTLKKFLGSKELEQVIADGALLGARRIVHSGRLWKVAAVASRGSALAAGKSAKARAQAADASAIWFPQGHASGIADRRGGARHRRHAHSLRPLLRAAAGRSYRWFCDGAGAASRCTPSLVRARWTWTSSGGSKSSGTKIRSSRDRCRFAS